MRVCGQPFKKKRERERERHISAKRKKINYIIVKSLPNCEGRAGPEEEARLSGVVKTEEQRRVGGVSTLKRLHAAQNANKAPSPQRIRRHTESCTPQRLLSSALKTALK